MHGRITSYTLDQLHVRWVHFREKYHNSRKYTHPPIPLRNHLSLSSVSVFSRDYSKNISHEYTILYSYKDIYIVFILLSPSSNFLTYYLRCCIPLLPKFGARMGKSLYVWRISEVGKVRGWSTETSQDYFAGIQ